MKKCPYCDEMIQDGAIKCRYCKEMLKVEKAATERKEWKEGEVIEGTYTIQQILKGEMSSVYIAFDSKTAKFYAIKTFQERFLWDEKVISSFMNEAQIWVNLDKHRNVVKAELVKLIEGKPYLFLEYVEGNELEDYIREKPLSLTLALDFALQFCEGMDYAYQKLGLLHRDIKPANCLISKDGILKITDFRLGKVMSGGEGGQQSEGEVMAGTLSYMAPELLSDVNASSIRSDVYAFGVMLYEMISGNNPFDNEDPTEVITNHLGLEPEPLHNLYKDIPESLSGLVAKCIDKDFNERFEDFAAIKNKLAEIHLEVYDLDYEPKKDVSSLTVDDWINKGVSLASLNCHNEAILNFEEALKIDKASVEARIYKGISLLAVDRAQEACHTIGIALNMDPGNAEAWFHHGNALARLENAREALESYQKALKLEPENPAEIIGKIGSLLACYGKYKEALQYFDNALERNPKMEEVLIEKGTVHLNLKQLDAASNCFKAAIEVNPRNLTAWQRHGKVLALLGSRIPEITDQRFQE